jgi:hypothetical protein
MSTTAAQLLIPKCTTRSNRSSGYGLKHGVEQDPAELHGSSLQGMLDKWNSKN